MQINLTSDTVTIPNKEMIEYMMGAAVGDDVFGQDPSVNKLQNKAAAIFNMEAGLFCPSGTMTNQIALKINTNPLDEVICHKYSHIYQYETGGYSFNANIAINLLEGPEGKITHQQIEGAIKLDYDWLPSSKLVSIESTTNKGGGAYYNLEEIRLISEVCRKNDLKLHLDGARIFNALIETKENAIDYSKYFDTISICLSKGLGAPIGSLLLGSKEDIKKAKRFRKVLGGGMRQAGYLAAAGIYALDNNVKKLKLDHIRAKNIASILTNLNFIEKVHPIKTNIILVDVIDKLDAKWLVQKLNELNIGSSVFGPKTVRLVTHLGITDQMIEIFIQRVKKIQY